MTRPLGRFTSLAYRTRCKVLSTTRAVLNPRPIGKPKKEKGTKCMILWLPQPMSPHVMKMPALVRRQCCLGFKWPSKSFALVIELPPQEHEKARSIPVTDFLSCYREVQALLAQRKYRRFRIGFIVCEYRLRHLDLISLNDSHEAEVTFCFSDGIHNVNAYNYPVEAEWM